MSRDPTPDTQQDNVICFAPTFLQGHVKSQVLEFLLLHKHFSHLGPLLDLVLVLCLVLYSRQLEVMRPDCFPYVFCLFPSAVTISSSRASESPT